MDKYVLLTGANGGIGKSILDFIKNDYKVIALDVSDSNIKDSGVPFIKCDITKDDDLNKTFNQISTITDNLYAIVNTVGIFMMQSIIEGNESDFRKIFDINFFGIYSLNKKMFPLLKEGSKIVILTSELANYSPQPFQGYYNLTKMTLDNYADVLRRECNYLGIKVIKLQSGSMKTNMLSKANNDFDEMVNNSKYFKLQLTKLKYMMEREITKTNDPLLVAKTIKKILDKKNPKIRYRIKNSASLKLMGALPESTQDKIYKKVIK